MSPCRTPFEIVKKREVEPPHLMHNCCVCYEIQEYEQLGVKYQILSEICISNMEEGQSYIWCTREAAKTVKVGNYKCGVQVVYDGGKRENKWVGKREWDAE